MIFSTEPKYYGTDGKLQTLPSARPSTTPQNVKIGTDGVWTANNENISFDIGNIAEKDLPTYRKIYEVKGNGQYTTFQGSFVFSTGYASSFVGRIDFTIPINNYTITWEQGCRIVLTGNGVNIPTITAYFKAGDAKNDNVLSFYASYQAGNYMTSISTIDSFHKEGETVSYTALNTEEKPPTSGVTEIFIQDLTNEREISFANSSIGIYKIYEASTLNYKHDTSLQGSFTFSVGLKAIFNGRVDFSCKLSKGKFTADRQIIYTGNGSAPTIRAFFTDKTDDSPSKITFYADLTAYEYYTISVKTINNYFTGEQFYTPYKEFTKTFPTENEISVTNYTNISSAGAIIRDGSISFATTNGKTYKIYEITTSNSGNSVFQGSFVLTTGYASGFCGRVDYTVNFSNYKLGTGAIFCSGNGSHNPPVYARFTQGSNSATLTFYAKLSANYFTSINTISCYTAGGASYTAYGTIAAVPSESSTESSTVSKITVHNQVNRLTQNSRNGILRNIDFTYNESTSTLTIQTDLEDNW